MCCEADWEQLRWIKAQIEHDDRVTYVWWLELLTISRYLSVASWGLGDTHTLRHSAHNNIQQLQITRGDLTFTLNYLYLNVLYFYLRVARKAQSWNSKIQLIYLWNSTGVRGLVSWLILLVSRLEYNSGQLTTGYHFVTWSVDKWENWLGIF